MHVVQHERWDAVLGAFAKKTYYHVTELSNLDSIVCNGLELRNMEKLAFSCDSPNLCGSEFTDGIALSIDEIEDTLREALILHFKPLGYTFDGLGCNYLKIIWRSEKE